MRNSPRSPETRDVVTELARELDAWQGGDPQTQTVIRDILARSRNVGSMSDTERITLQRQIRDITFRLQNRDGGHDTMPEVERIRQEALEIAQRYPHFTKGDKARLARLRLQAGTERAGLSDRVSDAQHGGLGHQPQGAPHLNIPADATPTERMILERLARLEQGGGMNQMGGGVPWMWGPPAWWSGQQGGHAGGEIVTLSDGRQARVIGQSPRQSAAAPEAKPTNAMAETVANMSKDEFLKLIEGVVKKNKEEVAPAAPQEHAAAAAAFSGRTKDAAARVVAEKEKKDPKMARKWLSAWKRWPLAAVAAVPTGMFMYLAQFVGAGAVKAGALSLGTPAGWLAAGALGKIPATIAGVAVPFIGGAALPAIPVIATALIAAGVWHFTGRKAMNWASRRLTGSTIDEKLDVGWKAKKLYKKMEGDDSQAALDRKYNRIRKRPSFLRMQSIPRALGSILGGGLMHDALAGYFPGGKGWYEKSVVSRWGGEAVDVGKRAGRGFEALYEFARNPRWPEWLSGGPTVDPALVIQHEAALRELENLRGRLHAIEAAGALKDVEISELSTGLRRAQAEIVRLLAEGHHGGRAIAALETELERLQRLVDGRYDELLQQDDLISGQEETIRNLRGELERMRVEMARLRALGTGAVVTERLTDMFPGTRGWDRSELIYELANSGRIQNIPNALKALFEDMGLQTRSPRLADWLADTINQFTYNGLPGVRSGERVVELLTGQRVGPRLLQPGDIDIGAFFRNNQAMIALEAAINRSDVLTTGEKAEARRIVEYLQQIARRGT